MYPFFLTGIAFKEYDVFGNLKKQKHSLIISILLFTVYIVLSQISKADQSFYFFLRMNDNEFVVAYAFMIVTGLIGIISIYLITSHLYDRVNNNHIVGYMIEMGKYTLAIYMMQGVLVAICDFYGSAMYVKDLRIEIPFAFFIAVLVIVVLSLIIKGISNNRILSRYLLGKA